MSYPIEGESAHVRAVAVGEFTLAALRERVCGDVVAKFEHSLYVRFSTSAFACIGAQSIGAGPLNVLLAERDWPRLRTVSLPQAVEASAGVLALGKHRIALTGAARWHPRRSPVRRELLAARLHSLTALARRHVPRVGLSRLAFSPQAHYADPVLQLARPGWNALESWLVHAIAGNPATPEPEVATLIGLGPGLTPSGDDIFCGVLIAAAVLGLDQARGALWSWLLAHVDQRTSVLSAAHLRAAAIGHGHSALHAVLDCSADDESALDAALYRLGHVGHCSGWDALAGVALVWRTLAAHEATRRVASSAA